MNSTQHVHRLKEAAEHVKMFSYQESSAHHSAATQPANAHVLSAGKQADGYL